MAERSTSSDAVISRVPLRKRDRARAVAGEVLHRAVDGELFLDTPRPTDARQGVIGDCYLLSALSALAQAAPSRLRSSLVDAGAGRYRARFHRRGPGKNLDEEWVAIDGRVPVHAAQGRPIYARSAPRKDGRAELWPLLYEKAYAAWRGGYDVIGEGGMVDETLEELTGEPSRLLFTAEVEPDALWRLLLRATAEGWPATVCTYGRAARPGLDELGIHPNHILIFLGAHVWKGRRIVWLRDPFDVPAVGKIALPDPHGLFTLRFEHFLDYFAELIVNGAEAARLRLAPWPRATLGGIFQHSYILDGLPRAIQRQIGRDFKLRRAQPGEVVAREGQPSAGYFLIQSGRAVAERRAPSGRRRTVAHLRAGDKLGEESLLWSRGHSATVRALTPLVLYRVAPQSFREWIARHPELAERLRRRFLLTETLRKWARRSITSISVDEMLRAGRLCTLPRGKVIFRAGDAADGFYLVLDGEVQLTLRGRLASRLRPGEVFGEFAANARAPRATTARATTRVRALKLDVDAAARLVSSFDLLQRQLEFFAARTAKRLRRGAP
jgi:CRP-like cAMP-binding protein